MSAVISTRPRTVPDDVQVQAKALGDSTRFRIFRYIFEAARPVGVAELTSYTQLNHNAVRQHLDALTSAGLVTESLEERTRPGRPRSALRGRPRLSRALGYPWSLRAVGDAPGRGPSDRCATAGGRPASRLGSASELSRVAPPADALAAIEHEMARRGFRPVRRQRPRGVELVLERCPFESAAAANPGAVCSLHRGLAEGLAEGIEGVEVEDLVAKNPHKAGCRLVMKEA